MYMPIMTVVLNWYTLDRLLHTAVAQQIKYYSSSKVLILWPFSLDRTCTYWRTWIHTQDM